MTNNNQRSVPGTKRLVPGTKRFVPGTDRSLYDRLEEHSRRGAYPMHMPGHKRSGELPEMGDPFRWDITEIEGFDDLHEPEGVLKEGMEAAADLYGAERSWYLINGSTAGILAGIGACTGPGDHVLVARNCHKAVYHSLVLNRLRPVYLHPAADPVSGILSSVDPVEVELALEADPDIALVVITSPTYEGILSDVQMIAQVCHSHAVPLLVDEAHGAHLSSGKLYTGCFPEGAVSCGADLVVQSLHKTLLSLTQTGLLHQQGSLTDPDRVKHMLDIYQTSSPSYVLMASIDRCIRMLQTDSRQIMGAWARRLQDFYREVRDLRCLSVITLDSCERFFAWDPSKLVISTAGTGHTGRELMEMMRQDFHIEAEMASADYLIAMTGAGDSDEGIRHFTKAVTEIDRIWAEEAEKGQEEVRGGAASEGDVGLGEDRELRAASGEEGPGRTAAESGRPHWQSFREEKVLEPWEAEDLTQNRARAGRKPAGIAQNRARAGRKPAGGSGEETRKERAGHTVSLDEEALGAISLEFLYAYPPGIPVVVPGERITPAVLQIIRSYREAGIPMRGCADPDGRRLRVREEPE